MDVFEIGAGAERLTCTCEDNNLDVLILPCLREYSGQLLHHHIVKRVALLRTVEGDPCFAVTGLIKQSCELHGTKIGILSCKNKQTMGNKNPAPLPMRDYIFAHACSYFIRTSLFTFEYVDLPSVFVTLNRTKYTPLENPEASQVTEW